MDLAATNTTIDLLVPYVKGGIPELHFTRLLGALTALPDPWSLKPVTLTMQATGAVVFAGDVVGYVDRWMDGLGWIREYRALGLCNRANYIPVTDADTLTDTSVWNLPGDDPAFIASRAGQTVGQIVTALLTMSENATALNAAGVGAYTSSSPWTLPTATTTDLSALSVIPPWRVAVAGERILTSLENFVQSCHPNHWLHVQPDGTIRFLDSRTFASTTLTMGTDPRVGQPMLTRDATENYSQVEVRGNTLVRGVTLQTLPWPGSSASDGGLQEDFAWGSYTNAQAKANWVPSDWSQPNQHGSPLDTGTCSCTDTTHVVISTTLTLTTNQLAQGSGELLGQVMLYSDSLGGNVNQLFQARIIANTATSGGSCTITLDVALPSTTYGSYQLFGLAAGANVVGRRYKVSNAAIGAALQNFFPYPVAWVSASGTAAEMISSPMGIVMYNPFGGTSTPYNATSLGITLDPTNGLVYFDQPTQVAAYGVQTPVQWAANVQAFVPVAYGTLEAYAPSSTTYAGTLYTVEGIERTKTVTVLEWRDYSNDSNMATFATELLDSVKDVVVEGTVPYLGLDTSYLTPGNAVSVAGDGYTTGWESLALPVVSAEITFQSGDAGTSYLTTLHLSNRRGRYNAENFLRPNITGAQFGADADSVPALGAGGAAAAQTLGAMAALTSGERSESRTVPGAEMPGGPTNPWQQAQAGAHELWGGAASDLDALYAQAGSGPDLSGLHDLYDQAAGGLDALYGAAGGEEPT